MARVTVVRRDAQRKVLVMQESEPVRLAALRWCEIAVDSHAGVTVSHPVYRAVTEGRDPGPVYSSCADLAHWFLFRMGVRSKWINRQEHRGWKTGINVSALAFSCPVARPPKKGELLKRGDVAIIWNQPQGHDAHVFVVDDFDGDVCRAWDYGQAAVNPERWDKSMIEGKRTIKALRGLTDGAWMVGARKLQRVLALPEVMSHCQAAGELAPADDHDEWLKKVTL